jgi:2-polyprenyl-6-methoxyphenol 4-hydroxylase
MINYEEGISLIGGGMVGASLALLLAKTLPATPIRLFECAAASHAAPQNEPAWDGRSTALAPTSVSLFRALGVWPQLAPFATAIERIHVSDQGSWGLSQFTRQDNNQQPLGQVVENSGLQSVLQHALNQHPNIELIPQRISTLKPRAEGMQLSWLSPEGEQTSAAKLVILADGADSPLRHALGIPVREVPYEQTALVANVRFALPHGGCAFERFCPQGPMALLPRGQSNQGRVGALVWTFPRAEQTAIAALGDDELIARLQEAFGHRLGRFEAVGQRQFYPLRLLVAKEQVRSHLVLQGNAAHFLHPVAGQGFNLALRDGLRLAEILSDSPDALGSLAQLKRYEQAVQEDQTRTISLSDGFNRVFSRREPHWRWGRDFGMLLLETLPPLRQAFIQQLSGKAQPVIFPWGHHAETQ